jgi:hypothetical protein
VTRDSTTGAAGAPEASTPGVTLRVPTHMAAPSHALVLREGPKPTWPHGRIPRVARPRPASRAALLPGNLAFQLEQLLPVLLEQRVAAQEPRGIETR